ncbi:BtrH N-terminal domain-containing protein [Algoriella sp.]|uniref:BtrH N-terminal domain-containing protein n=1 Tax=Algoriella sp. TaxID=1872434 RepID=UPI001AFE960E|nr:BtrH N-terminal domain-containing protein [Algoriella sp.]MBO6212130.1 BtrH N-terminal domain-containing protein [Algoriella sp.]
MSTDFKHFQSAHCENGVASNLLKNKGIDISEPMIFGLGSGLFFVFLPFLKVNHAPAISYRPMPGMIFNRAAKNLGIKVKRHKFKSNQSAQQFLDQQLKANNPCGLQVGVYNLTYFPEEYKFHFNGHNLVVYGKENDSYLISDPVMETTTALTENELEKVRFAKGVLAPKGHLYYPEYIPDELNFEKAIKQAIKKTCREMLAPVPIVGVRGIRMVAKRIKKWPTKIGNAKTNYFLAQMVRMQEEIGTGGGGFRYIYAAFLQEASVKLNRPELNDFAIEISEIGDKWRDFAVNASRVYKKRSNTQDIYNVISNQLLELADLEESFFKRLRKSI